MRKMFAGDRLCAARVLGLPYPQPEGMRDVLDSKAQLLRAYDYSYPEYSWRRWMIHNQDPGDEDRSER